MKKEKSCRESRTDGGRVASFSLLTEASEIPWAWSRRSAELKWDYRSRDSVADTKLDYRKVWNLNMEESAPILLLTCLLLTPSFTPHLSRYFISLFGSASVRTCGFNPHSAKSQVTHIQYCTWMHPSWRAGVCHRLSPYADDSLFISQLQFVLFTHQTGRTHFICLVFRTGCWVFK